MEKVERVVSKFCDGFLCSQAILSTYGPQYGLDADLALKLAAGLGGGMGRMAQTCGAVTGSILVIGLKKGAISVEDTASKEDTYQAVREFSNHFKATHGSIICKELLGCDISESDGYKKARQEDLFKRECPKYVGSAVEILEKLLNE